LLDQYIDFITGVVAPEIEVRCQPLVVAAFHQFADDEVFEQGTARGMDGQMCSVANAHQMRGQAGVVEIQLGGLDQPFAKVLVVRLQQEHDVARLQHRQPGADGLVRHTAVIGQVRHVEQLPAAGSAHLQKSLKEAQVLNLDDLAHVAQNWA
jgi:hypothetical protein